MEFVNNVKKIRTEKGIRQNVLADMIGMSRTQLSDIERGRGKTEGISIGIAFRISEALECTVEDLFLADYGDEISISELANTAEYLASRLAEFAKKLEKDPPESCVQTNKK